MLISLNTAGLINIVCVHGCLLCFSLHNIVFGDGVMQ